MASDNYGKMIKLSDLLSKANANTTLIAKAIAIESKGLAAEIHLKDVSLGRLGDDAILLAILQTLMGKSLSQKDPQDLTSFLDCIDQLARRKRLMFDIEVREWVHPQLNQYFPPFIESPDYLDCHHYTLSPFVTTPKGIAEAITYQYTIKTKQLKELKRNIGD